MNTRQLSYILSIAQNKSLSSAASELGISQPALSKYLSELEEELGTDLFLRHKKRLYLTAAGRIYVDAAQRIIEVHDQTYRMIHALSGEYQKTLTIGVTPLRGAVAIARIFPQFQKKYPHVQIQLKEHYAAELRQSVIDHSIDLALGTCIDLEDPDVLHISANEEELVLFVPSFHPLAPLADSDLQNLTSIDIRKFQDTPFLLGGKGSTMRKLTEIIFHQNQMNPTIVFEANNNLILKNMVQNGAGVCLLPHSTAEPNSNVVYFSIRPRYFTHLSVMIARDHTLSVEERYLIALIFALERDNPNYHFNPTPLANEILNEFHLTDASHPFSYGF